MQRLVLRQSPAARCTLAFIHVPTSHLAPTSTTSTRPGTQIGPARLSAVHFHHSVATIWVRPLTSLQGSSRAQSLRLSSRGDREERRVTLNLLIKS